jgi:MscS family membrane protein
VCIGIGERAHADSSPDSASVSPTTQGDIAKMPLKLADTSSPRATLQSFLDNMNGSYRVLMAAHRQNTETSGIFTSESVKRKATEAERLFKGGVHCLDLSEVPSGLRKEVAYDAALQLKEILDRIELPPAHLIPDADDLEKEAGLRGFSTPPRWRLPKTDIVIARVKSGPREGEYLFTLADDIYYAAKDLPYKSDVFTSDGFFEFCVLSPGWLMPPKWNLWLPDWSKRLFLSHTVWQWCALLLLLLLWFFFVLATFRTLLPRAATFPALARHLRRALFFLATIVGLLVVHVILSDHVNISGSVLVYARFVLLPIWWFLAGAMVFFIAMAVAETIIASPKIDPTGIQASYYRALFGVLGFAGGGAVLILGLSRIGISLIPLLTGVGVGGIAVALAARPTLEGIISSFTIFADNPYRVGERVNVLGHFGTVESIGLRSTRIRLLNGHVTAIPNEKMAASEIENIGRRPYIRRTFNITVTYATPREKIDRAVEILKQILSVSEAPDPQNNGATASTLDTATADSKTERPPHPNEAINKPEFPPRVYFDKLNADSLNIYVSYWYHPPKFWEYMEHAHRVNGQIIERLNAEGINFAFPTQTVHLAGEQKRPLNDGQRPISDEETV